jgi:hypothetical protein
MKVRIHERALPRLAALVMLLLLASCTESLSSAGAPCGRNQHAFATVTLPDTGIDARHEIQVSFIQHDPDLAGELSEVAIQQSWPAGSVADSEPDPRVRLVNASGAVFVDTLGTRYDQPSGQFDRPTWLVLHWIRDEQVRNGLYDALAAQSLWIELSRPGSTSPGTRVRLTTTEFGVSPTLMCL